MRPSVESSVLCLLVSDRPVLLFGCCCSRCDRYRWNCDLLCFQHPVQLAGYLQSPQGTGCRNSAGDRCVTPACERTKAPFSARGAWRCRAGGNIGEEWQVMDRKHNPALTANARALRKNMTKEERHLWYDFLKCYPIRFLRQKVIDRYIVDFYCHDARLVVELDGSQHYDPKEQERDHFRTTELQKRGLLVVRIPNNEVNRNFRGVCEYIDEHVRKRTKAPLA